MTIVTPPPYQIISPSGKIVPIVVSVPHCSTRIPDELVDHYETGLLSASDDTDFFVDKLYDLVPALGITMITSSYNRWLIDLNRSPNNQNLYDDGRIITSLVPTTDFLGNDIYKLASHLPNAAEISRRMNLYYYPYYQKLRQLLNELKATFGQVLLWDAHSIRRRVHTIQKDPFPDLILGDNDGAAASAELISLVHNNLSKTHLEISHNSPFKGGNITRSFGHPETGIHAIQLEMCKECYMDDDELYYNDVRADKVRAMLKTTFELITDFLLCTK